MGGSAVSSPQGDCDEAVSEDNLNPITQNTIPTAPFPLRQILILGLCRLSEPIAMTSSFPYLYFMIQDFHIAKSDKSISRYAGILAASFCFAQVVSGNFIANGPLSLPCISLV